MNAKILSVTVVRSARIPIRKRTTDDNFSRFG